jgi:hypothetical protein
VNIAFFRYIRFLPFHHVSFLSIHIKS